MAHEKSHVRDWMTPNPETIAADASLTHAYNTMKSKGIRRLPVIGKNGTLVGIITFSDVQQVLPFFHDENERVDAMFSIAGMTVEEVMTKNPFTVAPEDPIQRVAKRMQLSKVSGLPVVDNAQIVGIITESDIFRMVVESWPDDGQVV